MPSPEEVQPYTSNLYQALDECRIAWHSLPLGMLPGKYRDTVAFAKSIRDRMEFAAFQPAFEPLHPTMQERPQHAAFYQHRQQQEADFHASVPTITFDARSGMYYINPQLLVPDFPIPLLADMVAQAAAEEAMPYERVDPRDTNIVQSPETATMSYYFGEAKNDKLLSGLTSWAQKVELRKRGFHLDLLCDDQYVTDLTLEIPIPFVEQRIDPQFFNMMARRLFVIATHNATVQDEDEVDRIDGLKRLLTSPASRMPSFDNGLTAVVNRMQRNMPENTGIVAWSDFLAVLQTGDSIQTAMYLSQVLKTNEDRRRFYTFASKFEEDVTAYMDIDSVAKTILRYIGNVGFGDVQN